MLAVLGWASVSMGATVDGTIVTNVASVTYSTTFVPQVGSGYSVSYASTALVLVQDPCIDLKKFANPTEQAPGQVVTFTIWVVNCSKSASAFDVWVADKLPANTSYRTPSYASSGSIGPWWNYYSTDNEATYLGGEMPDGTPANGITWVGYWLEGLAIGASAYVSYQVTVQ